MTTLHEIEEAALKLAPEERFGLVSHLVASLDEMEHVELPEIDPRWFDICQQRLDDLDSGRTKPLDGEEVMRHLRELAKS